MTTTISGADVYTPQAAAEAMQSVAAVYADLLASIDQSRGNLVDQGVSGEPIDMLTAMLDAATTVNSAAQEAAAKFRRHRQFVSDTVGSDPSLAGTQSGKYMDPAAL
jgi:predicted phage tail protein